MPRTEDETLFKRILSTLPERNDLQEKSMFGGKCVLVNGNIAVGTWYQHLVVRLEKEKYESYLEEPNTKPFDITGRPMKGWVLVDEKGIKAQRDLKKWVSRALKHASSLPVK